MKLNSFFKLFRSVSGFVVILFTFLFSACGNASFNQEWVQEINNERRDLAAEYLDLLNQAREHQHHLGQEVMHNPGAANPAGGWHFTMMSETQRELTEMYSTISDQFFKILTESEGEEEVREKWSQFLADQRMLLEDYRKRLDEALRVSRPEMHSPPDPADTPAGEEQPNAANSPNN
ncbi:MAG: hypothetical protein WD077_04555 [Bacteroidia bacterium]